MISFLQALILGIIQGITEWLPISSSGHLALAQMFFGLEVPVVFDIMLHISTMFVVLIVFWEEISKILKSIFSFNFRDQYGKLALFILIGSVPTAIIGFTFRDFFENLFYNLTAIALALIFTGIILFFSEKFPGKKKLNTKNSFLIGLAQGIAIIPGVSRSGITISTGLLAGIDKRLVTRFSFLLSLPAIFGAFIFEAKNLAFSGINVSILVISMIISFVTGYISLKLLLKLIIKKNKFHLFGYYCFFLGLIILLSLLF